MSKRSTRGSNKAVEDNDEEETGRVLRTGRKQVATPTVNTPTRKSGRVVPTPLYDFPSSADDATPPPAVPQKRGRGRSKSVEKPAPVSTTRKSGRKASVKKGESDDDDEEEEEPEKPATSTKKTKAGKFESDTTRRSVRTPKPVMRLGDGSVPIDLVLSPSPAVSSERSESVRKSGRRKLAEDITPVAAKVAKKAVKTPVTPGEGKELRKSTRKVATPQVDDTPKDTPGKRGKAPVKVTPKEMPVKKVSQAKGKTPAASTPQAKGKTPSASTPQVNGQPSPAASKKLEWKFNVYGIPKCPLPCREAQFEEIWKFLFENVSEKNSGCMYVSGVPGTGKTVIVQAVVDTMKNLSGNEKKNLKFKYLYINGLTLSSPDKIWKRMFKGLETVTRSISTKEALKRLDSYFESLQRDPVILVVDELDQILDKQQSILYQLLEWSSHSKNMFSFVAIFNTMSLPENGLAMRNYSRMGFKRAVFPPYSYEQLQTIVSNMLATFKSTKLSNESVTLLSRKVAAISGDARRALEIARRALEIAEAGNLTGIQAVSNAFKEIFSSAKIETIKHTSLLEQLILKSLCEEVRCSGMDEVLIAKIIENVIPKAVYEGMQWPKDEILKALMRLALMHLIIVEDNISSLHKRVLLKVPVEDVNFALGIHEDV